MQTHVLVVDEVGRKASAPRGRPLARGTEAAAEGGEGVGGLHTSVDVGELVGNLDPIEQRRPVWM